MPMKWEHAVDEREVEEPISALREFLRLMSREGWELVSIQNGVDIRKRDECGEGMYPTQRYFFKRPDQQEAASFAE
jgi:acetoin utilization deacetylase AcuC-like enzyme